MIPLWGISSTQLALIHTASESTESQVLLRPSSPGIPYITTCILASRHGYMVPQCISLQLLAQPCSGKLLGITRRAYYPAPTSDPGTWYRPLGIRTCAWYLVISWKPKSDFCDSCCVPLTLSKPPIFGLWFFLPRLT